MKDNAKFKKFLKKQYSKVTFPILISCVKYADRDKKALENPKISQKKLDCFQPFKLFYKQKNKCSRELKVS